MPLLLTSLFAGGAGAAAPASPDPDAGFAWTERLLYHFRTTSDVFADSAGSLPAQDNDPVALWGNQGAAEDAVQSSAANRPLFRTGGLGGHPWIDCDQGLQQFFEDLAFTQPSGFTALDPYTVFVVTDQVDNTVFPAVIGSSAAVGGKVGFYFRTETDKQVHFFKSALRSGTVIHPQVIMGAVGRNAAGDTSNDYTRFWIRQNGTNIFSESSQTSNATSTAIASTEFLRCTGITETGGYFQGRLYEVLLYQGTLDDPTTFAVESFLAEKYGLALA